MDSPTRNFLGLVGTSAALAAYASYVINATQFVLKLRAARLQQAQRAAPQILDVHGGDFQFTARRRLDRGGAAASTGPWRSLRTDGRLAAPLFDL